MELQADIKSGRIQANEKGNAPVRLKLNGLDYDQKGELLFSEVSVDEDTGAILLRAEFLTRIKHCIPACLCVLKLAKALSTQPLKYHKQP